MADLGAQVALIAGAFVIAFFGPALAGVLLSWRKRRARARRRSPIGIDLLRGPGHALRAQLDELKLDIFADLVLLTVVPLSMLAMLLAQALLGGGLQQVTRLAPMFAVMVLAFVAYLMRKLYRTGHRLDHLKAGYDAELAVGQELDQLMRRGARVYHDLPADDFNIDHVVVAREGIFAVETKGFTKPQRGLGKADATVQFDGTTLKFPTWTTKEPLEQAARQADWLTKWLASAVGSPFPALPVLALPGWFVERKGRGEVRVFSGKELEGLLASRGAQPLSDEDVQRVAHQVEQRCRTVAPRYAEAKRFA